MNKVSNINLRLIKPAVFGATDGIITTFAVVASVAGARLSPNIVIIMGIANMIADGVSMGLGDFLGERSEQTVRQQQSGKKVSAKVWQTGLVTFGAFVIAGTFPLLPYLLQAVNLLSLGNNQFFFSIVSTGLALFIVGSLRSIVINKAWWQNGLEMLLIGSVAALVAYFFGYAVDHWVLQ
jgi:vacuolar iron transporter family protein